MILHVVRIVILSGIVTGIIGLVQWRTHFIWMTSTTANVLQFNQKVFKGQSGFELQQWQGQFRIDSIVGTPDYLPLYMQTIAPFVAIMLIRQKRWAGRVALFSVLSLFAACHLLSYTRGALITTAVTAVFAGWVIDRRRFLIYGPILALACAVALVGWSPWRTRLATIFDLKHKESADTVNTGAWRLDAIPVGLGIIAERPLFGVGVGQGKWNWPESAIGTLIPDPEAVEPPPFHNDYLGIGVEMGLTGLVIFLTLLATTIRQLQRLRTTFQQRGDQELADVSTALLIAMVGLMAAMMLYPLVGSFRYVWLIFGLSGALVRYADQTTAATLNA